MDITAQIKENLINRIKNSKDLNFLKALQTIFDSSEKPLFPLSQEQSEAIEAGRNEIESGDYVQHDKAMTELSEWLQKK